MGLVGGAHRKFREALEDLFYRLVLWWWPAIGLIPRDQWCHWWAYSMLRKVPNCFWYFALAMQWWMVWQWTYWWVGWQLPSYSNFCCCIVEYWWLPGICFNIPMYTCYIDGYASWKKKSASIRLYEQLYGKSKFLWNEFALSGPAVIKSLLPHEFENWIFLIKVLWHCPRCFQRKCCKILWGCCQMP